MCNRTMKKKVVHRLPITTTHTTPIYQRAIPKHEIIQSENPIMSNCPQKKATRLGIFGFQTPFQGNKEFETL